MVYISSKSKVFDFSGGQKPHIRELTTIERSWNYGNLPYLVANIYELNFIKIGGIWIFRRWGWGGGETPYQGGYTWPAMPIFEFGWAIPVKNHVWKFGLDWLKSKVCEFSGGKKTPIRGVTFVLRCPFSNLTENNILGKILFPADDNTQSQKQLKLIPLGKFFFRSVTKQNHRRSSI